jgi:WD40 repeat protein
LLATGGDDTVVRIYQISKDFKNHEKKLDLTMAQGAIQSVDISRDNRLLIAGSKDGTAYIVDLTKNGTVI